MQRNPTRRHQRTKSTAPEDVPEVDLSEEDILEAMREIPGYIDITTSDFRIIYELAHAHAVDRLFTHVRARDLMRADIEALTPELQLVTAARILVRQGLKSLPVVDARRHVVGMFTQTDVLRQFGAESVLALLLAEVERDGAPFNRHTQQPVGTMMTTSTVTVADDAGFHAIIAGFHNHAGRGMPVIDAEQRLVGMLLRRDFMAACHVGRVR